MYSIYTTFDKWKRTQFNLFFLGKNILIKKATIFTNVWNIQDRDTPLNETLFSVFKSAETRYIHWVFIENKWKIGLKLRYCWIRLETLTSKLKKETCKLKITKKYGTLLKSFSFVYITFIIGNEANLNMNFCKLF